MILKSCVCGASKKNFKMDIGPFYVGECCKDAGYDDLGRLTASSVEGQAPETADTSLLEKFFGRTDKAPVVSVTATPLEYEPAKKIEVVEYNRVQKPSRKKLKNMRVEELVALASANGLEFKEGTTKPAMIDAILAAE